MNALSSLVNYSDDDEEVSDKETPEQKQASPIKRSPSPPPAKIEPKKSLPKSPAVEEKEEQKPTPGVKVAPVPIPAALRQQDEARRRRALLAPKPIDGIENWGIPPEPDTACDEERAQKVAHFLSLRASGHRLNDHLKSNKAFRNPRIYAKLVEMLELDETGSNFPKSEFDPHGFPEDAYIDGILKRRQQEADEKALAQKNRTSIPFVSATSQEQQQQSAAMAAAMATAAKVASRIAIPPTQQQQQQQSPAPSSASEATSRKRSSKWDQPDRPRRRM